MTSEQLEAFQLFAREKIGNGGSHLSFDELVELWMLKNLPPDELQESLRALEEGVADAAAGRVHSVDEVFDELSVRYGSEAS